MKPFQIALSGVLASALVTAIACTPLPDLDDNSIVPDPLDSVDAAACDSEAAPSICSQLPRR